MMTQLQHLLVGSTFRIPPYQRDYSWEISHVDDLLNDIEEAVEGKTSHYLGTFVLSRAADHDPFEVVDGQQRLTTLFLIVGALLQQLPTSEQTGSAAILFRDSSTGRIKMHFGVNDEFATRLLTNELDLDLDLERPQNNDSPVADHPLTAGQRRLHRAYQQACVRAQSLYEDGSDTRMVRQWIETIKKMDILHFQASDTGRAIRMFQTVNDRGLSLSTMDKVKALLIYYSNRYLDGKLDETINCWFGKSFVAFDRAKDLVRKEDYRIDNISRDDFRENDLLRYHYLAYDYAGIVGGGNFKISDRTLLDGFLKPTLLKYKDTNQLEDFIHDYAHDLSRFFEAFHNVVEHGQSCTKLYKLFVVLGMSTRLYPLLIRLHQGGLLETPIYDGGPTLLSCLETCGMRLYEIGRSAAAAKIVKLSQKSQQSAPAEIGDELRSITEELMPDYKLRGILTDRVYDRGFRHLLVEYDEHRHGCPHTLDKLRKLVRRKITFEHVFPSEPGFDVRRFGFADMHEYFEHIDRLGNALPLSRKMNAGCGNKSPADKMSDPKLYKSSCYVSTQRFAMKYKNGFRKEHLVERTKRLADWVMDRWRLWEYAPESPAD